MTRAERKELFLFEEKQKIDKLKGKAICQEEKNWFRTTHVWKDHRKDYEVAGYKEFKNGKKKPIKATDPITGNPLSKKFNLHHLDLNPEHYTDLNKENFVALNQQSHTVLHWIYTQYCKDPTVIDKIEKLVLRMYELNNGKDVKDFKD